MKPIIVREVCEHCNHASFMFNIHKTSIYWACYRSPITPDACDSGHHVVKESDAPPPWCPYKQEMIMLGGFLQSKE